MTDLNSQSQQNALARKAPRKKSSIVFLILLVILALAAGYFYKKYSEIKKNPNAISQKENSSLIETVGKLIELPQQEQPTIATVTDLGALKDQPFFANAKLGDKVLIYVNAKKAILYRPEINKIVEVAPVNINGKVDSTAK